MSDLVACQHRNCAAFTFPAFARLRRMSDPTCRPGPYPFGGFLRQNAHGVSASAGTCISKGEKVTGHNEQGRSLSSAASVAAGYDFSIVVRRWLGAWIDFIVLLSFLLVPDYVLGNETYRATLAIWLSLLAAYFPVTEMLFGRTLGKLVTRTRVVNDAGSRPSFLQAIVRTLFRLIEVNPILVGGLPAGIAVIASRSKQRLGDMVAGTYVLLDRDARQLQLPATATTAEPPPLPEAA
jgi:uncharacterized RDD family membrane protein YckC